MRNSVKVCVQTCNPSIYFNGCSCHIFHNATQKDAEQFSVVSGFDAEEFIVNISYWFDKSTKRKNMLQVYCQFCGHSYRSIIKHVSMQWLSLKLANECILEQFPELASYFKSEDEGQAHFRQLQENFQSQS